MIGLMEKVDEEMTEEKRWREVEVFEFLGRSLPNENEEDNDYFSMELARV